MHTWIIKERRRREEVRLHLASQVDAYRGGFPDTTLRIALSLLERVENLITKSSSGDMAVGANARQQCLEHPRQFGIRLN